MRVIKVGADWCPECLIMKPRWAEIEQELTWLQTEFVDLDQQSAIKQKYQIDKVPVFIFLDKNGQEFARKEGLVEKKDLIDFIQQNRDK